MRFGQLTNRESSRDTAICLATHHRKLYHFGITYQVNHSTLALTRSRRIYSDLAQSLPVRARKLYHVDDFGLEIPNTIYALDATNLDLCLSAFWRAAFRKTKAAVKPHTLLDLRGNLPTFIDIFDGKMHDVNISDELVFESTAIYLMQQGYLDFARHYRFHQSRAFFATRAEINLAYTCLKSGKVDKTLESRWDQTIKLISYKSKKSYPEKLLRVKYCDKEQGKTHVSLPNNVEISAIKVVMLHKYRWQIELF